MSLYDYVRSFEVTYCHHYSNGIWLAIGFLQARCPDCQPTSTAKALNGREKLLT